MSQFRETTHISPKSPSPSLWPELFTIYLWLFLSKIQRNHSHTSVKSCDTYRDTYRDTLVPYREFVIYRDTFFLAIPIPRRNLRTLTVTRHQEYKQSKAISSLFPIKIIDSRTRIYE